MDAQQLAQINQLRTSQGQARNQRSNQHCDQGFACLAKALETPVLKIQKPLLLEACDAFAEAIKFQRTNPEPYIGFAYVLVAIGNHGKAIGYVKEAQRLQPAHPDVNPLLEFLQKQAKAGPAAPQRPHPGPPPGAPGPAQRLRPQPPLAEAESPVAALAPEPEEIDYDELYDSLELEIAAEVKTLTLGTTLQAVPSMQPQRIKQFVGQIQELKQRKAYFEEQLQILDVEIDTSELTIKLKPLELALRRFERVLAFSRDLAALCAEIAEQQEIASQVLEETKKSTDPEDIPIVEENLEVLLDQSDLLANRLDALEAQSYSVDEGVKVYEKLIKTVEELQEALEDLKENLRAG